MDVAVIRAPHTVTTARLLLRRPEPADAEAIFSRYSSDPHVTRYVGWPAHRTVADTRAFLAFSDDQWDQWPAGPYLACSRADGTLLGSTGLMFETPQTAMTGYVFATDAWGRGYATEALEAMIAVARNTGVYRLYALCHAEHRASARVLEKCGFMLEATRRAHAEFPNLQPGAPQDVRCYICILENATGTAVAKCS
jgi:[ribosomal protein S5]-alanine N-acetyltransferase